MRTELLLLPPDWIKNRIVAASGAKDFTDAARKLIDRGEWSPTRESLRKAVERFHAQRPYRKVRIAKCAGYDSVDQMTDAWRASCSKISTNNGASPEELNALANWADAAEMHGQAKEYLLKLLEAAGPRPTQARALLLRRIAKQEKHLGNFREALHLYEDAKDCFHSCDDSPGAEFVAFAVREIDFQLKMVEWFKNGNSRLYLDHIREFATILKGYAHDSSLRLQARYLHLRRQEAEALRNVGRYSEAEALAAELEEDYTRLHMGEEAAWARVIKLDAKRMACDLNDREDVLRLIDDFSWMCQLAECHDWRRMLARVKKGCYDLRSASALNPEWQGENPELGAHFFARVYGHLVNARHRLITERGTEAATEFFHRAYELARSRGGGVHLESAIAEFGIAEANRKRSRRKSDGPFREASFLYTKLVSLFTALGCPWGVARSRVALHLMGIDFNDCEMTHQMEGADATIFNLLSKTQHANHILFDRLP